MMTTAVTNRIELRIGVRGIITPGMDTLWRDIRLAIRRLRLNPGFTLFAVASLALGIGVSTAVYSAVRTFFWMPLGIPEAAQLSAVSSGRTLAYVSWLDFQDLQAQQTAFRAVAGSSPIRTALVSPHGADVVTGEAVSEAYFSVVGLAPRYGRLLAAGDVRDGARVVVLSEHFWR